MSIPSTDACSAQTAGTYTTTGGAIGQLDGLSRGAPRTAFLAGVGGCGMRGLASLLLECGWQVWGADSKAVAPDDPLVLAGLQVLQAGQSPPAVSLAVRSVAVPVADPQFAMATADARNSLVYAELLGEITRLRDCLAVAGSHGKTTITGWIAYGLRMAGRNPGFLVGGGVSQLGGSAAWGDLREPLVAESCEYDRTFHQLSPQWVALCNVDAEHPDTYPGGYPEVEQAFEEFLARVPATGTVFAGPEAPDLSASTVASWIPVDPLAAEVQVGLAGEHNRLNGALVAAVLRGFRVEEDTIRLVLKKYQGANRRMEQVGELHGAVVFSDYAHHPTEIAATLQAATEMWPQRRLVAVLQPHQARRFDCFREQFVEALDAASAVLLLPIFRARDPEGLNPTSAELEEPLRHRQQRDIFSFPDHAAAAQWLASNVRESDMVVCLGAGDIDSFARSLCQQ